MLASARPNDDLSTGYAWQRSFREVCQAAVRVFNLMDKYQTAPFPNAYAVLFAYTTGSNEALVEEVNNLLMLKDQLSPYDIESLYQEFLAEEASTFATQGISQAIGNEIGAVLEIIEQGLKQTDDYSQSLDSFSEKVPEAQSGENLAELVQGLVNENRRMAALTRDLNQGLVKSQGLITVLNQQLEEVQAESARDSVTGVSNRRAFDQRLSERVASANAMNEVFYVVMAQLDNFEMLSTVHGLSAAEGVLKGFASLLKAGVAPDDMVARYGGEEFAIIMSSKDLTAAYNTLVKLKHDFRKSEFPGGESQAPVSGLTASFGLAKFEPGMTARQIIEQADTYLLEAKKSGRNQVKARGLG
jgi:diguanylate cyclase